MLMERVVFLMLGAASVGFGQAEMKEYAVIVYGGTAGGTMAAIAARVPPCGTA